MAHIKEPDGVDLVINSRPLTKEEELAISKFIQAYKEKNARKKKSNGQTSIHHLAIKSGKKRLKTTKK